MSGHLLFLFSVAALAGCTSGGGGGDPGGPPESSQPPSSSAPPSSPPPASPPPASPLPPLSGPAFPVTGFDEAAAQAVRNSSEFQFQGTSRSFSLLSGGSFTTNENPFAVINLEYAHAAGLSGKDQLIAIIDSGFRTTHQELAGKTILTFGSFPSNYQDHGTGVAAVAAGNRGNGGMVGVAPDANLHLSPLSLSIAGFAAATDDARINGAIVQNNSWGFVRPSSSQSITIDQVQADSAPTLNQNLANVVGGSSSEWTAYLSALEQFSSTGVIVFSASNTSSETSANVMAGLPSLQPSLQDSWITAVNAIAEYDGAGNINGATRVSAGCLEAAAYCLMAQGVVRTASDESDSSYKSLAVGTSFAAPQVSGAVALMGEAFPNLQPSEIVDRLLASANNSFFTQVNGTVDFGNGVTHGYSQEFGHGFLDLKAALMPIGSLGLATTEVASGPTVPVSQAAMIPGGAQGNAFHAALAGRNLALFDALGTDFYVSAETLLAAEDQSDDYERLGRFVRGMGGEVETAPGGFGFSSNWTGLPLTDRSLVFGWADDVIAEFAVNDAISPLFESPSTLLGLAPDARAFGTGQRVAGGHLGVFGFADVKEDGSQTIGLGASRAFRSESGPAVTLGFSGLTESDSFLGMTIGDENSFETSTMAFSAGVSVPVGNFEFFATSEYGMSQASNAGLITSIDPAMFTGFAFGSRLKGLFNSQDILTFSVQQPLRIETGSATLRLPVGRDQQGQVMFESVPVDLEPEARQLDFGLDYAAALSPMTDMRFGAVFSYNENHTQGRLGAGFMAAMQHRF
ncbi:MAG: S8 family peptidase [Pseudomonadota bacterium]